jgi:hypothetical protein
MMLNKLGYDIHTIDYLNCVQIKRIGDDDWVPKGHFYSPYPDLAEIHAREEEVFDQNREMKGIDLREDAQLDWLRRIGDIYPQLPSYQADKTPGLRYCYDNANFSYSDAIVLYSMLRLIEPKRLIEVGSGFSSAMILDTNELFFNRSMQLTFVDPHPERLEELLFPEDRTRVRITAQPVQQVGLSTFQELEDGDVLFIDSTHVSKVGSDVNYLYFEVLPRLSKGVYIHIHDIFLPFEYPKVWVYEGRVWNEAYILRAFLSYNPAFQIEYFQNMMYIKHREFFEENMPLCLKSGGDSIWIRKVR